MILLDYEVNTGNTDLLKRTLPIFVQILRESRPHIPIVVLSEICLSSWLVPKRLEEANLRRDFQKDFVRAQRVAGDCDLHFIDGSLLLGDDWHETSVDGVHPTDLGFYRMAQSLKNPLEALLFPYENQATVRGAVNVK